MLQNKMYRHSLLLAALLVFLVLADRSTFLPLLKV